MAKKLITTQEHSDNVYVDRSDMPSQVRIIKTKAGKFRVKYYGTNGEILAVSEILETKVNANKNIAAMKKIFAK